MMQICSACLGESSQNHNIVAGLVDLKGARVAHRKLDCKLSDVVEFLAPYRKRLNTVAVESTFNCYWLVDGLKAEKFNAKIRPVRDLLRRRMSLVQHRTSFILSFKSLYTRTTGQSLTSSQSNELDLHPVGWQSSEAIACNRSQSIPDTGSGLALLAS